MEKIAIIAKNLEELFPECQISLNKKFKTVHSEIFVMDIKRKKANQKVLVKFCGLNNSAGVLNEHKLLSIFNSSYNDDIISSPKPLSVDPDNGILIMEYVEGKNLKDLLLKLNLKDKDYLSEIIDLSAIALSRFHYTFREAEYEDISIDSFLLEADVNTNLNNNKEMLSQCNLQIRSKSFIDFAVWNIIIDKEIETKIYLIDFPEQECICNPHLDLARFKYSLAILKQYPQFRFFGMDWWDLNNIYDAFLRKYCAEMKINLNKWDYALINYFERIYARKAKSIYSNNHSNIKFVFEGIYLKSFIKNLLIKDETM